LARSGLVFWDSVVSLLVCSWVKFSQDWIFLSWYGVAIDPDGKKLTSSTGTSEWRHKNGKAKTLYSFDKLTGKVESRVYDDEGTLVRHNGKHLNNDSQYQTNIIFQLENNDDTVKNATNALANKHPENSYIAKMDEAGNIKVYDVDGNEVALNVNGKYRINVVGHGSSMKTMGAVF
jgi:hypothetical protein